MHQAVDGATTQVALGKTWFHSVNTLFVVKINGRRS